ncbi:hydrogenase maturation protease [Methylococcales bacterium]|nr:hydrogenase maturation protease [Methylococcales bacterium]
MKKPILVFGYGNLSRGDDAVGPLLLEYLEQRADLTQVELLTDFQLQIEHALDLQDRDLVIFVDASVTGNEAFVFSKLKPCRDNSYTSHAMSPAALLQVFETMTDQPTPPSFLLSIKAESFELGEAVCQATAENLRQACRFAENLLTRPLDEILQTQTAP